MSYNLDSLEVLIGLYEILLFCVTCNHFETTKEGVTKLAEGRRIQLMAKQQAYENGLYIIAITSGILYYQWISMNVCYVKYVPD